MTFNSQITLVDQTQFNLPINIGNPMFILGANGTGKSSLMRSLCSLNQHVASVMSGHRQVWLDSNIISITASQKFQQASQILNHHGAPEARHRDIMGGVKVQITLYELVESQNKRAREITILVDDNNLSAASNYSKENAAPIDTINEVLASCNIPISIKIDDAGYIVASKNNSAPYSVAELSDGERTALLMGISVLTAKAGTLFLIDEPERHLHKSIVVPLLKQFFLKRSDCAFVISTHDLALPIEYGNSTSLLVRSCSYHNNSAHNINWDVDILPPDQELNDELKASILGSRRKILFIEGDDNSLDKALYALLFPDISIISKGGCEAVKSHVKEIKEAQNLHWIKAFSIVDKDQMDEQACDKLKAKGIYALNAYSIESLYYHQDIQKKAATALAEVGSNCFG